MELEISNVKVSELKEKYGTPLYVYDEVKLINQMSLYKDNFKSDKFQTEVLFASKSFCIKEMLRLVNNNGLSLDVVSMGEFLTALSVDFPLDKIYFHGNNKSFEELSLAVNKGINNIVIDNFMELEALENICIKANKSQKILIRINCGVDAHTHKFIITSHIDSKFGLIYNSEEYKKCLNLIKNSKFIILEGFHSHIGSQIFDYEAFFAAFDKFIPLLKDFNYPLVLNIGGGFGVHYTDEDHPQAVDYTTKSLVNYIEKKLEIEKLSLKKVCIEPGRSIVGEAGYTLYTIGYTKKTPNRLYYFIDGGMTDNIRPALYQAKYDCDIANKMDLAKTNIVSIAGKCCESGDVIIENTLLPEAVSGDLLVTYTTGAYGYSMSSNYNKALTPGVVFVNNGISRLVSKRQTYEELLEREI